MAIFSSARTAFLSFEIVLTDASLVAKYNLLYPNGVGRAPYNAGPPPGGASIEFAAPWIVGSVQPTVPAPFSWSPESQGGSAYRTDVAKFTLHTGGFLGIGGTTTTYYWIGRFKLAGTTAAPANPGAAGDPTNPNIGGIPGAGVEPPLAPQLVYAPIAKRRWVEGFEIPEHGPFQMGVTSALPTRDAAKEVGGIGMGFRENTSSDNTAININAFTPGLVAVNSWERFYVRLRRLPDITTSFWRCRGVPSGSAGASLELTPTGDIIMQSVDPSNIKTLIGTVAPAGALPVWDGTSTNDAWRRLDLLIDYNASANAGTFGLLRVYINGILQAAMQVPVNTGGLGGNSQKHGASAVGNNFSGGNVLEIDVDHWISADTPIGRAWNGATYANGWDPLKSYAIGAVVLNVADDHVYKCILGNGLPPTYNAAITYQVGENVNFGIAPGTNYTCIAPTTGNAPPNGTYWTLLTGAIGIPRKPTTRTNKLYWNRYEGLDWLNGSKVVLVRPKAFSPNHNAAWVGDFRTLSQNGLSGAGLQPAKLSTTTTGVLCAVTTDSAEVVDADKQSLGVVAVQVTAFTARGTTDGTVGYSLAGAAPVSVAEVGANATFVPQGILFGSDGVTAQPTPITPLELRSQKGADVSSAAIRQLLAQVEMIGTFGPQDWRPSPAASPFDPAFVDDLGRGYQEGDNVISAKAYYSAKTSTPGPIPPGSYTPPPPTAPTWVVPVPPFISRFIGQHNAPYIHSPWSIPGLAAAPGAAFIVKAGTYVGNDLGQDLTFRAPVHLFFVRPLTGGAGGAFWTSVVLGAHQAMQQGITPCIVDAQQDLTFAPPALDANGEGQAQQYRVRLCGNNAQFNANTVVYQYLAVSDPGARFILNSTFAHNSVALGGTVDNPVIDPTFLADFLLLLGETVDNTSTKLLYGKSAQQAPASLALYAGGVLNNALTIAAGKLTSQNALHALAVGQFAVSLFRKHDGNNDPGEAGVFSVGGYLGDGNGTRSLSPAVTGRRPLYALFFSEGATGYSRDPSHTTNLSTSSTGADVSTAITGGGIDTVTLGALLNVNGVNYSYLIFWADATAGNGGWGVNGEFIPVEAAPPVSGPFPADPPPPDTVIPPVVPVGPTGVPPVVDLSLACIAATQTVVNIALSRIGVTKQIADLAGELTQEAFTSRLHLNLDVETTLRDFPWPFATRYATLVLVGGTPTVPVNDDWQYSYRAPALMVAARRIVSQAQRRRAFDPSPIVFEASTDDVGPIIYTNARNDLGLPLTLEYTIRMTCPALQGDALFRDALAWRHAASLAPALSRDAKRQTYCQQMYAITITGAKTAAAREQQQEKSSDGDADWIAGR